MMKRWDLLRSNLIPSGKKTLDLALWDTGVKGTSRFRLVRRTMQEGEEDKWDTWTSEEKEEFEELVNGNWKKWENPHSHQVVKDGEVVYIREAPPGPAFRSDDYPRKGRVIKDVKESETK